MMPGETGAGAKGCARRGVRLPGRGARGVKTGSQFARAIAFSFRSPLSALVKIHPNVAEAVVGSLLEIFKGGKHADKIVEKTLKGHTKWGSRDRRFVAETVYDLVRWWRSYWSMAGLPDDECGVPEWVSSRRVWRIFTVYYWRQTGSFPGLRECNDIHPGELKQHLREGVSPAVRASLPDWMDAVGRGEIGKDWVRVVEALNEQADVFLRTNTLRITAPELRAKLAEEGVVAAPVEGQTDALRLAERRNVLTLRSFRDGLFEVQDAASQQVAPFLEAAPGMRVIDACAGAGGKTLHLAALMRNKGTLIALDIHQWKLDELRRRATRAGADNIQTRLIEGPTASRLAGTADRVLLDVPCSGLGVLRRNPDTKWKLKPEELDRLRAEQADLLDRYSKMTKPGGKARLCHLLDSPERKREAGRGLPREVRRRVAARKGTPPASRPRGVRRLLRRPSRSHR